MNDFAQPSVPAEFENDELHFCKTMLLMLLACNKRAMDYIAPDLSKADRLVYNAEKTVNRFGQTVYHVWIVEENEANQPSLDL